MKKIDEIVTGNVSKDDILYVDHQIILNQLKELAATKDSIFGSRRRKITRLRYETLPKGNEI